ncbi:TAXI family TRAP transporter solute-binding subunit [Halomonas sp. C05BenzN]|uniref:TAXI family TRAP transporter solute-binding subunit n=1 Tax=Halomonas sp. C05BenzN TaxID=3411041 RepID=UPI003B93A984
MKINFLPALALAIPVSISAIPDVAEAQDFIRMATGGSGGNYYRLGSGLASIWNDEIDGVRASVQSTGGTVQNLELLAGKEVEIAYLAGSIGKTAYDNEGNFSEHPEGMYKGLRSIATVYSTPEWFVVMDWASDVESVRDIQGKRVSVGMIGSQAENWWKTMMDHLGWTYDDIQAEYTQHQAAIDQVRNRQIDVGLWSDAPGSSSIQQIMDTGNARLLNMDEDIVQYFDEKGLDFPYTIPAKFVPGSDEPLKTFASPTTLATHEGLSEDVVYEMTKVMFEEKQRLIEVHPLAELMVVEDAISGLPFPLHPGAERFYKEQGIL